MNVFVIFSAYWQEVYHWSIIMSAVRMLPIGIAATAISFAAPLAKSVSVKYILLIGYAGMIVGTVLLTQANSPARYWSYVLPAFLIGSAGTQIIYIYGNVGIFRSTPPSIAGVVGAMFNGALQLGAAVGSAASSSIHVSVEAKTGPGSFEGRAASFFFTLALVVVSALGVLAFYDDTPGPVDGSATSRTLSPDEMTGAQTAGKSEKLSDSRV